MNPAAPPQGGTGPAGSADGEGTENTNGPIRQYFPKSRDFTTITDSDTQAVMDTPQVNLPFLSENEIELKADVAVSGNPIRMRTGVTALRTDDEWCHKLSPSARRWTLAICGRTMKRYGYRHMNDSYSGNRLTLLQVVHDFLPYHSHGSEQATYHLARAQLEAGHRVAVVARVFQFLGILRYACVGSEGLREMDLAQGKVVY